MLNAFELCEANSIMTNYVHPLSPKEQKALKKLHRDTKDAEIRSRCQMILLSNEGLKPPQVAQSVRVNGRTVRRYIARYEAENIDGLQNRVRRGRKPRVTADYLKQLESTVEHMPRDLDLPYSNWTTVNLAEYMAQKTDIRIKARQMENYLKRYGWRLRRPVRSVKHRQNAQEVLKKKS